MRPAYKTDSDNHNFPELRVEYLRFLPLKSLGFMEGKQGERKTTISVF